MPYFDTFLTNPLRTMKAYLLGRGLVSFGVIVASMVGGPLPALAVGIGGALFTGFMRLNNQSIYEDQMVNLYRDDIAQHLGMRPQDVTRAHLKIAAQDNEVIDQALKRQKHKNWISFGTAALAGAATVALVSFGLPDVIAGLFSADTALGKVLGVASLGVVSAISSLVIHNGLDALIGQKTGVSKAAAHDRILEMERGMERGWGISKEQVYGVLVAGNPVLQATIRQQTGKEYAAMKPAEQGQLLERIGVAEEMHYLASEINAGRFRPSSLAYMMSDVNPRRFAQPAQAAAPVPAKSHVQSLGLGPRAELSHTARIDAERAMLAERAL